MLFPGLQRYPRVRKSDGPREHMAKLLWHWLLEGKKIKMEFLQPFSFNFNFNLSIIATSESYHIRILHHPRESNFLNPITHHRLRHLFWHLLGLDHPLLTLVR